MAENERMEINVVTTGVEKSKSELGSITGQLAGVGKAALGAAAAYMTMSKAIDFVKESVRGAVQEQQNLTRLRDQVRNLGMSWVTYGDQAERAIRAVMEGTAKDDDAVTQTLTKLMQLTGSYANSIKYLALAQDMETSSILEGMDASRMLGQVLSGNFMMIGRYVPELKDTNEEFKKLGQQDKVAYAMDVLQRKFGGLAAQALPTAAGQAEVLRRSFEDMEKAFGQKLLPTLTSGEGVLSKVFNGIERMLTPQKTLADTVAESTGKFSILMQTLISYRQEGEHSAASTQIFDKAIKDLNTDYPDYLGNLNLEKAALHDLTTARDEATRALTAEATVKYMLDQQDEEIKKLGRLQGEAFKNQIAQRGLQESMQSLGESTGYTQAQLIELVKRFGQARNVLDTNPYTRWQKAIDDCAKSGMAFARDGLGQSIRLSSTTVNSLEAYRQKLLSVTGAMGDQNALDNQVILQKIKVKDAADAYNKTLQEMSGLLVTHTDKITDDAKAGESGASAVIHQAVANERLLSSLREINAVATPRTRPADTGLSVSVATPDYTDSLAAYQDYMSQLGDILQDQSPWLQEIDELNQLDELRMFVAENANMSEQKKADAIKAIGEKSSKTQLSIEEKKYRRQTSYMNEYFARFASMAGQGIEIANAFGAENYETGKAFAKAQAIIAGIVAAVEAWRWGMEHGGPLLAIATAGFSVAATAAQIAQINAQHYALGTGLSGVVSGRPGIDTVPVMLTPGEIVIDRETSRSRGPAIMQTAYTSSPAQGDARIVRIMADIINRDPAIVQVNGSTADVSVRRQDYARSRMTARGYTAGRNGWWR